MQKELNKLLDLIKDEQQANQINDKEAFFNLCKELLESSDSIIGEMQYLNFSRTIDRQKAQIDGFAWSDTDNILTLFIISEIEAELQSLPESDLRKYVRNVINCYLNAEELQGQTNIVDDYHSLLEQFANHKKNDLQKINIVVLTNRKKSDRFKKIENIEQNGIFFSVDLWDLSRLSELIQNGGKRENIIIDLTAEYDSFPFEGIEAIVANETEKTISYLFSMPGIILAKLYNQYQSRLLESNIRAFLSFKGKINKGIKATILNEPNQFFIYNNGITATAKEVEVKGRKLVKIIDLQIVNGGQTTAALGNAYLTNKNMIAWEDIFVMTKLNVVKDKEHIDETIGEVAKYANSQNKVSNVDLFSNHQFHIDLHNLSVSIPAPRSNNVLFDSFWFYERANGQYATMFFGKSSNAKNNLKDRFPKQQVFTKTDLAKHHFILYQEPETACLGGQKAFQDFAIWIDSTYAKEQVLVDNYFKTLVANIILFKETDKIIKIWQKEKGVAGLKAPVINYTLSLLYYLFEKENLLFDFQEIWQRQSANMKLKQVIHNVSYEVYTHLTAQNLKITDPAMKARQKEYWALLKRDFNLQVDLQDIFNQVKINADFSIKQMQQPSSFYIKINDEKFENKAVRPLFVDFMKHLIETNPQTTIEATNNGTATYTHILGNKASTRESDCYKINENLYLYTNLKRDVMASKILEMARIFNVVIETNVISNKERELRALMAKQENKKHFLLNLSNTKEYQKEISIINKLMDELEND